VSVDDVILITVTSLSLASVGEILDKIKGVSKTTPASNIIMCYNVLYKEFNKLTVCKFTNMYCAKIFNTQCQIRNIKLYIICVKGNLSLCVPYK